MTTLEHATLGRSGLSVSRLGFGSLNLGGPTTRSGRYVEPERAERVLHRVLDLGVNLIDTAPDYGEAEAVIGRFISHRRHEYVLTSKCGCPVGALAELPLPADKPREHIHTRQNIRAGVEQSLRRLRTEYLDLVQVHNGPTRAELEANDSIAELFALRDEGKIRAIGMSSALPEIEEHLAMDAFDAVQVPYSALQLEHHDVIAQAGDRGNGVIVRGGVAQGSLTMSPVSAPDHRRAQVASQQAIWSGSRMVDLLAGMSPMEFVLRFVLSHPSVTTTIVGTANPEHLEANVEAASRGPLPADLYAESLRRLRPATN
jgi:aryl-alcohol dehydrogenase-like predicted oxidoreductase